MVDLPPLPFPEKSYRIASGILKLPSRELDIFVRLTLLHDQVETIAEEYGITGADVHIIEQEVRFRLGLPPV